MRGDETSFFYAVLVKGGSSQYALAAQTVKKVSESWLFLIYWYQR